MKIGILTLSLHANYGGILQAWALQTVLERMGHEAYHIQHNRFYPMSVTYFIRVVLRIVKNIVSGKRLSRSFYEIIRNKEKRVIGVHTHRFIDDHINIRYYQNFKDINPLPDAIIVGSDQIWRPRYCKKYGISESYLDFCKRERGIKRIAYACSFGTDTWSYSKAETKKCSDLVSLFDAVSVRENNAVDLCKNNLGVEPVWVLDPTMLVNIDDYKTLIPNDHIIEEEFLVSYILDTDESTNKITAKVAKELNLNLYEANNKYFEDQSVPLRDRIQPPVQQWLQAFRDCQFVVTDSFHACVFSILFNKPFIVIGNKDRGIARIQSLLSIFNLQNRIVLGTDIHKSLLAPINWDSVNSILERKKGESLEFLINALKTDE